MEALRKQTASEADRWMTVKQAAKTLGMAPQTVYARALDGHLTTEVIAGRRLVSRESVDRLLASGASA